MLRVCSLIALIAALFASGCRPRPRSNGTNELWFRWQFAGTEKLAADTNATTLRKIAELPATQSVREATARRLLVGLQNYLQPDTNVVATNTLTLLRPLLDKAIQRGFIFEGHGKGEQPTTRLLAVLLQGDEARQWETNFLMVAKQLNLGEPKKLSTKNFGGWNITRPDKSFIDYLELSKWVVLGIGTDRQPMIDALHKIESVVWPTVTASNVWLAAEMDARHLGWLFGATNTAGWPGLELSMTGRNGNSFLEGRLRCEHPLALKLPAWNVPTNLVHDPLISFAAARGISTWLRGRPEFQQLALTNAPEQMFVWAQSQIPFQTFAATPFAGANNALTNLQQHLPDILQPPMQNLVQSLEWNSNRTELSWQRLPIIQPRARAINEAGGEFLYGALFPERPKPQPMPTELLGQLARTNLVYYDWEITQERSLQWRQLMQIWHMMSRRPPAARTLAAQGWIEAAAPLLGNSVTEITLINERELAMVRKSSLGLTGFELVNLAHRLDSYISPPDGRRRSAPPVPLPGQ